jgi:hypothetical protein
MENGLYFTGSVFRQDVKGLNAIDPEYEQFTADRDDFQKMDGSIKTGFKNEFWDANVSFKNTYQYTEVDKGAFVDDDNYYLTFDRRLLQYYAGYQLGRALRISVLGSFSDSERYYENDSSRVSNTSWDKTYSSGSYFRQLQTHELQFNYDWEKWRAVFGAGVYREKMFFESYFFLQPAVLSGRKCDQLRHT